MSARLLTDRGEPREGYIPVENGRLYFREIGQGRPLIMLHGGPDFDHQYMLPDMDRLGDGYRLIYYAQRGRGKSAADVEARGVTVASEMADLLAVLDYFGLEKAAITGHSWGGYLAMEFAIRHSERVSHMILMNTAPASYRDYLIMKKRIGELRAPYRKELEEITRSGGYKEGKPESELEYYRLYFGVTVRSSEHLERVLKGLSGSFTKENVLKGREIGARLVGETWESEEFDLFPQLRKLQVPTLLIHGEYDFIAVECAAHVAEAIAGARLVVLEGSGHFSFVDAPERVRQEIDGFFVA